MHDGALAISATRVPTTRSSVDRTGARVPDRNGSIAAMRTEITHTVNVVERQRGYFGGAAHTAVVTKYIIRVLLTSSESTEPLEWQVARRYSHFRSNHIALSSMFSHLPKLPPKRLSVQASMERLGSSSSMLPPDPELVASRMVQLDAYLKLLLATPTVGDCTQMRYVCITSHPIAACS